MVFLNNYQQITLRSISKREELSEIFRSILLDQKNSYKYIY
jgi:hypothetical protein